MPFCDIAVDYDPPRRRCDLVFDGVGLAIDTTARTPLLVSLLTNGRAGPDDALPDGRDDDTPPGFGARRGWPGDALDAQGRVIGSKGWLDTRSKQSEETRQSIEGHAADATAWIPAERGVPVAASAAWVPDRPGWLRLRVAAGPVSVALLQSVAG